MPKDNTEDYDLCDLISVLTRQLFASRCRMVDGFYQSKYSGRLRICKKNQKVYTGWICSSGSAEPYHVWSYTDFSFLNGKHVTATADERNSWHEKSGGKIVFYSYARIIVESSLPQKRS